MGGRGAGRHGPGRVDPADVGHLLHRDGGVLRVPGGVPALLPSGPAREVPRVPPQLGRHRAVVRPAQPRLHHRLHVRRHARLRLEEVEALVLRPLRLRGGGRLDCR